ncbi:MAG: putative 2,4-dichlorophenol 6-monooxygenase [Gammaproteobacteria bacterium]|nr:putative 2,4-dichlorophenol 6-monooxygenase [Gammaproteobacteria bacterium]
MKPDYEVIIVGGGPVGVALGIELGLHGVHTLILEKHSEPLRTPRAQSLSARSMEFFMRWGIDSALEERILFPKSFPQAAIWCSSLCGEVYLETCWGDNRLSKNVSPQKGVRVPLWITEAVLREKLKSFPHIDFVRECNVLEVSLDGEVVSVRAFDKQKNTEVNYTASYLSCCDGAAGPTKKNFDNSFSKLSDKSRMLGVTFFPSGIFDVKTIKDGIMYFVMSDKVMGFFGPIDLSSASDGLWLAQIVWDKVDVEPDEQILSEMIDDFIGAKVEKRIEGYHFWDMQVQIADFFSFKNRVFWLGDSAHAFAPTGGLGLNTGFGDAENLGWKLAQVINGMAPPELLKTYEQERYSIWKDNLNFAKQNAEEYTKLTEKFPPKKDAKAFGRAFGNLGDRFLSSSGLTLGYAYLKTPLVSPTNAKQGSPFEYIPQAEPGFFLPHIMHEAEPIYRKLSPVKWTLLVSADEPFESRLLSPNDDFGIDTLEVIRFEKDLYPYRYLLIRPDWHISRVGNNLVEVKGNVMEKLLCA